ncbi:MAG: hypothetical protein K6G82_03550 [Ruminococcus sp.]|nr:hypothetical protein [Ruminococcus sp.]
MRGMVVFLVFLFVLMFLAWCLNVYRHIRAGGWKGYAAVIDIVGGLLLAGMTAALALPLLK